MRPAAPILALAAVLTALIPGAASAFWTGTGSGSGPAAVGSQSVPVITVPNNASGNVPVSWTASTVLPSVPALNALMTYTVERSADAGATWQTPSGTCGAPVAAPATTCDDYPPGNGDYRYRVTATVRSWTAVSAISTTTVRFTGALVQPTFTATPPARSANPAPSFSWTGGGPGVSQYQCRLDGGAWASCTSPRALSGLADGSHTFMVRAMRGPNPGPAASHTWIVDTSAPSFSAQPPNPSASTSATFAFAHAAYPSLQCRLDAGAWAACTSPRTWTGLATGAHTVQVRALDAAGVATTAASVTWTIATAAPTITAQPVNPTSAAVATFAFSAPGFTRFSCRLDTGAFAPCDSGTITYGAVVTGSHTFTVRALDAAGVPTLDRVVTWSVVAPPAIAFFGGCPWASAGQSRLVGTTSRPSGTVLARFHPGTGTAAPPVVTLSTATFTFFGIGAWTVQTAPGALTAGATYTAWVQQTDATGGTSNVLTCTFTAT
jgi:hypothetical protein